MKNLPTLFVLTTGLVACAAFTPARHADTKKPTKKIVTYAQNVAPILYAKCAGCHHEGEVAPFNLMSYKDAQAKAKTIAAVVDQKFMPPWHAVSHGEFTNERTLSADQIATLKDWAAEGAPAGDLSKAPAPPKFSSNWHIGQPDFHAKPPVYQVPAEGADEYRCFVIRTNFDTDRYVSDVELKPGNHKVVHHVVVFVNTTGEARKLEGKDGKPGYASFGGPGVPISGLLGIWAPGLQPISASGNTGMWLPKGADLILQVHYHKDGKPETDQSELGLKFATHPVDKKVRTSLFGNLLLSIPAGTNHTEATADMYLAKPITMLDVFPHMHLLGHDMRMTATFPDGTKQELFRVDHYDFNWQTRYIYRQPVKLPVGTHLELVAHYDNSSTNTHNPNSPPKPVWFGEQTTDEMCFAIFNFTMDDEHILTGKLPKGEIGDKSKSQTLEHIFDKFDASHSGYIDAAQLAALIGEYRLDNEFGGGKYKPGVIAGFIINGVGKAQKGKLSKAEFVGLVNQFGSE